MYQCHSVGFRYTLKNKNNIRVEVLSYGGIIRSLQVPDKTGSIDDIVNGFDDIAGRLH